MIPASEKYIEDALYLMSNWAEDVSYFDETDGITHCYLSTGVLEINTNNADYTTYYLSKIDQHIAVEIKRLDNYKLHDRAQFIISTMDSDDYSELKEILARLADETRSLEALSDVPLEIHWELLLDALFIKPCFGERPSRLPSLKPNAHLLAKSVESTLKKTKRLSQWEWKEWAESGVSELNKLAPLRELGFKIKYPSQEEVEVISASDDFSSDILTWFDTQLSVHDMTLLAISPIDEFQRFGLVPTSSTELLKVTLSKLCIHHLLAPCYG